MGFMQKTKNKEPYEALNAKNGCLAAPFVYLIAGFVVMPSVAVLSLVIVLRESLAAWGGFIIVAGVILWILTLVVGAWAYVAGKRADSKAGPKEANHNHNYFVGAGGAAGAAGTGAKEPMVTVEKPEPKALPLGGVPWVLTGAANDKKAVGTIRKRA